MVGCFVVAAGGESVFEAKQRLLGSLGWGENPFVKDLRIFEKHSFLKYYCPLDGERVLKALAFDSKACVLAGPKGVGKTSAMYYAYYSLPAGEFYPIMLKQPPASLQELGEELGFVRQKNIVQKIFSFLAGSKKISRAELVERMRGIERKVVVFLDEAHLASNEINMEFKYLLDEVPSLRIVFSALGTGNFPDSLMHLVGEKNVFQRKAFSREEMKRIIQHRIEAVGGRGISPFTQNALEMVLTEQNLLSPRYVFDELNSALAKMALGEKTVVDEAMILSSEDPIVVSATGVPTKTEKQKINTANADWWELLSPSQQQVMQLLVSEGREMSLSEISGESGLSESTAFNCLYQLRGEDDKERERKKQVPFPLVEVEARMVGGKKKNAYYASAKVKNLFTMH